MTEGLVDAAALYTLAGGVLTPTGVRPARTSKFEHHGVDLDAALGQPVTESQGRRVRV